MSAVPVMSAGGKVYFPAPCAITVVAPVPNTQGNGDCWKLVRTHVYSVVSRFRILSHSCLRGVLHLTLGRV